MDKELAEELLEKVDSCYIEKLVDGGWQVQASYDAMPTEWIVGKCLSATITAACTEALS